MSILNGNGDGAMPPGRAPRRFLLRLRTWGVLTAPAVLAIWQRRKFTLIASQKAGSGGYRMPHFPDSR